MLKIYVRNDLNMRKGKIIAQMSHASMAFFIKCMKKYEDKYILYGTNFNLIKRWIDEGMPIEAIKVNTIEEFESLYENTRSLKSLIEDKGRTEFAGQLTKTCFATMEGGFIDLDNLKREHYEYRNVKQVIVVNNDKKEEKFSLGAKGAKVTLIALLKSNGVYLNEEDIVFDLNENEDLKEWLTGAFAKIAVKTNTEYFEVLKKSSLKYECIDNCLSFSPYENSIYDGVTSDLVLI